MPGSQSRVLQVAFRLVQAGGGLGVVTGCRVLLRVGHVPLVAGRGEGGAANKGEDDRADEKPCDAFHLELLLVTVVVVRRGPRAGSGQVTGTS